MRKRLRQLNAVRVPRHTVLLFCSLVLVPVAFAQSHQLLMAGSPAKWVHHHTLNYRVCNEIDQNPTLEASADAATTFWNELNTTEAGYPYPNPPPQFTSQAACHPSGSPAADLQFQDGHMGDTGWRASSVNDQDFSGGSTANNSAYHARHTHIRFNLDNIGSAFNYYTSRALVCREIGYAAGIRYVPSSDTTLGHAEHPTTGPASNTNDCMSFSSTTQAGKNTDSTNFTYTDHPGAHSIALVRQTYGNHGPDVTLSGSLKDAADGNQTLVDPAYVLTVTATGGPDAISGVKSIEIDVDGRQADYVEQPCTLACNMSRSWTLETGPYSAGIHDVVAVVTDQSGFQTKKTLSPHFHDTDWTLFPPDTDLQHSIVTVEHGIPVDDGCAYDTDVVIPPSETAGEIQELAVSPSGCEMQVETGVTPATVSSNSSEEDSPPVDDVDNGEKDELDLPDELEPDDAPPDNSAEFQARHVYHAHGTMKTYWEDPAKIDVNSVRDSLDWRYNGKCAVGTPSGKAYLHWYKKSGWRLIDDHSSLGHHCSQATTSTYAHFRNTGFCFGYNTDAYYDKNTVHGTYDGSFEIKHRSYVTGSCTSLLHRHITFSVHRYY